MAPFAEVFAAMGGEGCGSECSGSREEAAAGLLKLLEGWLGRYLGGADGGFKTSGSAEKH